MPRTMLHLVVTLYSFHELAGRASLPACWNDDQPIGTKRRESMRDSSQGGAAVGARLPSRTSTP